SPRPLGAPLLVKRTDGSGSLLAHLRILRRLPDLWPLFLRLFFKQITGIWACSSEAVYALIGLVKGKSFFQSALQKLNSQLELVLSCSQAKRDILRETLKSEQKWLEEKKEVLRAGTEHVVKQRLENERLSEHSVLQDTKKKIQKMKDYQNRLMETLADVLAEHFPLPTQETNADKKEKNIPQELNENLISLNEVLELLMNTTLETPHDPYISIDETFWPPYTEMLLRHGIAQRHPEDCFKIRLETFY
uniref:Centromere protein K n=1 Tax=Oncorhynchus tshawytscha TaxID=74940 RepID=A0AAZ3R5F7_ONCTS